MSDIRQFSKRIAIATAGALLLALGAGAVMMVPLQPAYAADLAAAKAVVDAAKAKGIVGEQGDGFLGLVSGSADPNTTAAVQAINEGRREAYAATAAKTGVTVDAAGQATARQLLAIMPPGQFYKPIGGGWTKK